MSTAVVDLARAVSGPVCTPQDAGYDGERAGHNLLIDDRPAVIIGATGAADVMAGVAFATEQDLAVGVRSTGHTASVPVEGGVLITTRRMQGLRVDPFSGSASAEAGVRWQRVMHESAPFGLAPLSGSSPSIGVVGYTLGGGLPLLGRSFGYAADHVRSLDVVTRHGMLRRVTPDQYSDLFWALRGGKGNFGVVTAVEFDLFPVSRLYGGGMFFRGSAAASALNAYRRWVGTIPDEMASSVALNRFSRRSEVPESLRGRFVAHIRIAYNGSAAEGEALVRPLREVGVPLLDTLGELPYKQSGAIHADPTVRLALRERTMLLGTLDEATVDELIDVVGPDSTCPLQFVELRHLGGALSRRPPTANAIGGRDARFLLYTASSSSHGSEAEAVKEYQGLLAERMAPWATGRVCVNFLGVDDTAPEDVAAGYDPDSYRRLVRIKRNYDPENMFRINHNIPPTLPAGRLGPAN